MTRAARRKRVSLALRFPPFGALHLRGLPILLREAGLVDRGGGRPGRGQECQPALPEDWRTPAGRRLTERWSRGRTLRSG
jgi:hypothetical protein